jgi:hypothetical protein
MFKHPRWLIAVLIATLQPCAAYAQGEWTKPRTGGEIMAEEAQYHFTVEKRRDDKCRRFGCLIVINETREYTMTGMYLDTAFMEGRGEAVWSKNLLYWPGIYPMRATSFPTAFKRQEACAIPARFEFEHTGTRETVSAFATVSLCRRPGLPFIRLRVRAGPNGRVILEDGSTP